MAIRTEPTILLHADILPQARRQDQLRKISFTHAYPRFFPEPLLLDPMCGR
jgi:hypothetical protein